MATAYILINSEIGKEQEVQEHLLKLPNVVEAYVLYGVYDLIAKIEAEDTATLKNIVTQNLRDLENVRSTMTMICVEQ
ncbi:MAG: Lrp/AsnC ligand binding domain-containing protein [Candidatus Heimdallarchaeota archaeon]|nr:Lrp/AsnC ligand binding domain-containing protein [Candidatus Heimdallarchaeota archaeon]